MIVNGFKFRKSRGTLYSQTNLIIQKLESRKKASLIHQLFFPKAYALDTASGMLTAIAAGAVGALGGEKFFGLNKWVGGAIGVGAVYLVAELVQSNKDGKVSCTNDGRYQIRSKDRNEILMATAKYGPVGEEVLSLERLGLSTDDCNGVNALKVQQYFDSGGRTSGEDSSGSGAIF